MKRAGPMAWLQRSVFPPIGSQDDVAAKYGTFELDMGWNDVPFEIANFRAECGPADTHIRIGWMRSVANIPHAFAVQSFTDELAAAAGRDRVEYLLDVLGKPRTIDLRPPAERKGPDPYILDTARMRRVIEIAAEQSGWAKKKPGNGRALGIAVHRSFLTYVATVVEVEVDKGQVRIPRVDIAIDTGKVIHPDRVASAVGRRCRVRDQHRADGRDHRCQRPRVAIQLQQLSGGAHERGAGRDQRSHRAQHRSARRSGRARRSADVARYLQRDLRGDRQADPRSADQEATGVATAPPKSKPGSRDRMNKMTTANPLGYLSEQFDAWRKAGSYQRLRVLESPCEPISRFDGHEVINLASNNYLGSADHPKLIEAQVEAAKKFGAGSGAVRTISGTMSIHMQLEERIADFKRTEACVVFQSGFAANAGTVSAILGPEDHIISDALNHASIIDGCRLSKAKIHVFPHKDTARAAEILPGAGRRAAATSC